MSYLKAWSTEETRNEKDRKKRKIHCFNKLDLKEKTYFTEEIQNTNISVEDLYILEDHGKKIEDFFSQRYENKIEKHVNRIENEINKRNSIIHDLDILIEFIAIQIYRTPSCMYEAIREAVKIADIFPILKMVCDEWTAEDTKAKFLHILIEFIDKTANNPISVTIRSLSDNYEKGLVVANSKFPSFITSDFPVCKINNKEISEIYFPISPQVCLFLKQNDKYNKNNGRVYYASNEMVCFINEIIRQGAKDILMSDKDSIKNMLSDI